jgi:translation initiation factor IF-2
MHAPAAHANLRAACMSLLRATHAECAQEAKEKERKARLAEMTSGTAVTLSTLATVDEEQDALQRMNLIVKADASGSLEAVKGALLGLPQDSVALRFLLTSTGPIQPSEIELAKTSGALVLGALAPAFTHSPGCTPSPTLPFPRVPAAESRSCRACVPGLPY